MVIKNVLATAALVAGSTAQFAQFAGSNYAISVNVPSDTASSGSGSIYLQISAPSGTEWVGFGQGSQMSGANMFIVYAADSNNVTVSPRSGTGHFEPKVDSDAKISVLEGTGITSGGNLVANIRCDSCLSWNGGSMKPTDSSSSWIWAYKTGNALDSTSVDASISQHDSMGAFSLDLTKGTGGSSPNPFVAASGGSSGGSSSAAPSGTSAPSQTAAASGTATATTGSAGPTSTGGVSNPLVGSNPSSSGSSHSVSADPNKTTRVAHATIMSLTFVLLFPLSSLTIYLGYREKVRHVHGPLQVVSIILMLVGLGLGVKLADKLDEIDGYHQVIGFVVVAWMVFFQPLLGLLQHLHFRKNGTRSPMGHGHRWVGRAFILLGIVNGGLGFKQAGKVDSVNVPTYSVVVYSVFAVVIFLIYIAVVIFMPRMSARNGSNAPLGEKPRPRSQGYEMHNRSADGRGYS